MAIWAFSAVVQLDCLGSLRPADPAVRFMNVWSIEGTQHVVSATPHRLCHHKRLLDYTSVVTPLSTIVDEDWMIVCDGWRVCQTPSVGSTPQAAIDASLLALYGCPPVWRKGTTL